MDSQRLWLLQTPWIEKSLSQQTLRLTCLRTPLQKLSPHLKTEEVKLSALFLCLELEDKTQGLQADPFLCGIQGLMLLPLTG